MCYLGHFDYYKFPLLGSQIVDEMLLHSRSLVVAASLVSGGHTRLLISHFGPLSQ